MRVELLRGAEADLLEAYIRFEQASAGAGDHFHRTLDLALENLRQFIATRIVVSSCLNLDGECSTLSKESA